METNKFKGLGVAMVTPFDQKGAVDVEALKKLTTFLIDGGVDYLVVQGTTGESPTLTKAEKQLCLDTVVATNNNRLPIVFGIGGNNTMAVVEDFTSYDLSRVDGILSASPYYNKPTQAGIYAHYKAIAEATKLPIILYNVPGRTASNVLPETTLKLANDFENIIAVKEASGSMEQIMTIIKDKPENFLVISGDDALTLPIIAAGGDGVISVVGNGLPTPFKEMVKASLNNEIVKARKLHYIILPIIDHLFAEGNPGGIKEVLKHLNIMENYVRLPLIPVSKERQQTLVQLTDQINAN
ncbi:4-hydroxy-tetrahydrodipicolinate synthase [Crocinitomix catalasitica]|uniref:4-hydroxy-tetrahydrodipicolinate synthase n=1 Tax=Crocinitomix catalasitica TaxID=184607 RepID=UPI00047F13AD|nr:4-hydroxy-tetrahydrodipicolinate synthase [Crocinitomix catalasitica]